MRNKELRINNIVSHLRPLNSEHTELIKKYMRNEVSDFDILFSIALGRAIQNTIGPLDELYQNPDYVEFVNINNSTNYYGE